MLNHFFCRCIYLKPAVVFIENNCPVLLACLLLSYFRLFNESIWQAQSRIFRCLVWGVDRPNICPYLQADASNLWVFLCWTYILTQLAYSQAFWWYKCFDILCSTSSCRKLVASFLITYSSRDVLCLCFVCFFASNLKICRLPDPQTSLHIWSWDYNFDVYTGTTVHGFVIAANSSNCFHTYSTSSNNIISF